MDIYFRLLITDFLIFLLLPAWPQFPLRIFIICFSFISECLQILSWCLASFLRLIVLKSSENCLRGRVYPGRHDNVKPLVSVSVGLFLCSFQALFSCKEKSYSLPGLFKPGDDKLFMELWTGSALVVLPFYRKNFTKFPCLHPPCHILTLFWVWWL